MNDHAAAIEYATSLAESRQTLPLELANLAECYLAAIKAPKDEELIIKFASDLGFGDEGTQVAIAALKAGDPSAICCVRDARKSWLLSWAQRRREAVKLEIIDLTKALAAPAEPSGNSGEFAAPAGEQVGLTDDEIDQVWVKKIRDVEGLPLPRVRKFASAVIAAHEAKKNGGVV